MFQAYLIMTMITATNVGLGTSALSRVHDAAHLPEEQDGRIIRYWVEDYLTVCHVVLLRTEQNSPILSFVYK